MKKKYFLIVGVLLLIFVGGYFRVQEYIYNQKKTDNIKEMIIENNDINSEINESSIEDHKITNKQEYDFQKNEIMFYENDELISVYNLKENNPYESNYKYNVLKSLTNINTPNKLDYKPSYILVSYYATEKKVDDFDFLTTIKILNLNGLEVSAIELNKTRFIAKSISDDLKYLYGIQLTKADLNDDYNEYKPALLDLRTKINSLDNIKGLESFKYSENVYGIFPTKDYLLLAIDNKHLENIKLIDLKQKKIIWTEKAELNKSTIKINNGIINILDNDSQNVISTKKINK
ncbi:hypothetical protein FG167_08815 [Lacinutrix sp. WUR7]|uniref:hypothetical protein n=1 Tax=Lacinutrix sp. WUR7 TaxID=2653681 RepID=UPI00193DBBA6|nr:hypothetical protein [Lacinutrix sp. WUR7]QRM89331.1 hypothetical protein FG167_08815 [Lacinutrix sp. WUR7]